MNFLSLIAFIFAPIFFALFLISPLCKNNNIFIRRFSKMASICHFVYALCFLLFFNSDLLSMSFQQEIMPFNNHWISIMGITATFAVDGLSLLLALLTCFLFVVIFLTSKYFITKKYRFFYSVLFILQTSLLGIFCAKDIMLFFLFWLLSLLPMYFLISSFSNENSETNATKYLIINSIASIFILFGILILYYCNFRSSGILTGNIDALSFDEYSYPVWFQMITFLGFLTGFLLKIQLFPFHYWYNTIQKNLPAPLNIAFILTSVPLGIYGIIRFNMLIFPTAFKTVTSILMILSVVNILYSAIFSSLSTKIKEIIIYFTMFMAAFIVLGLSSVTKFGFTGAVLQLFSYLISVSALFIIVDIIVKKTMCDDLLYINGLAKKMPRLFHLSIPLFFNILPIPFFMTFPAIFLVLSGVFTTELFESTSFHVSAYFAIFAIVIAFYSIIKHFQNIFFGNISFNYKTINDITVNEFLIILMLIIPVIFFGFAPMCIINLYSSVISIMVDILGI